MSEFKVIYRRRNYSKTIVKIEIIKAASASDAMWEAFDYARLLGLDADVFEA